MIPVFKPSMGDEEVEEVARVIRSGWIGLGPETEKFEKNLEKYLGKQHIVATNSATSALHLAMILADVKKGDEVISPALTFISTNHVILYQNATPVFCDVDRETLCADPQDIIKKITPKTKVITVVHYGGHPVDMDPIIKIAKEKNIIVVEDAAHALGGFYKRKPLGTIGNIGCYSFHAVKGVAMADGGAVFTKKKSIAARLKKLRWMGINKDTWKRSGKNKYAWQYSVDEVGYKYHPNDVLSALGVVQLKKYPVMMKRKRDISDYYNKSFRDLSWIELPVEKSYAVSALHNYCIKVKNREKLSAYLTENGIATTMHYQPNNQFSMYKKYSTKLPVTDKVWKELLLLPLFPDLTDANVDHIVSTLKKFKP